LRAELLGKTYRLKNEISSLALSLNSEVTEKEVRSKWNTYTPKPTYRYTVAEDGSFNKRHYLGFYLYSVCGYAVGYREDGEFVEEVTGDINLSVIKRSDLVDDYFRMLMFLSELKAVLRLSEKEKPSVIILDGTLSSRFITFFPKTDWFSNEDFEGKIAQISGEFIPEIKDNLMKEDITSFSEQIKQKVSERLEEILGEKGRRRDVLEAAFSKLAYFEYLLLLHRLFYGLDWNPVVIGVAKTSHLTEIFNRSMPDIRIFHQFIKETGYSEPVYVDLEQKKWEFSEVFEYLEKDIAVELKDISIKYFYGKYDRGRTISLIEVYENPQLTEDVTPERILDILNYYSVIGYPFLLKKADNEVRITNKDMDLIENLLDLKREIHGREGLK